MSSSSPHVIFYCDDCTLLEPVITVFREAQPDVAVRTISSIEGLLPSVRASKPEMILVYLHDPKQSYVSVLKQIREEVDFSTIELIIYRQLPGDRELEAAFKKFSFTR